MSKNEMRVKVLNISDLKTFENSKFSKVYVEGLIEGEYPQYFQFEFLKDNVKLLENVIIGNYYTISFNLRGSKLVKDAKEMFFVSLVAWKIE